VPLVIGDADERDRPVHPPAPLEPRAEIVDVGDGAVGVGQAGDQDRRVLEVALRRRDLALERDPPFPGRRPGLEQSAKQRIAVDARLAGPDEAGRVVDQRAHLAIADRPEV